MARTACEDDSDCGGAEQAHPACDTDLGVCVQCTRDEDCGDQERCSAHLCIPSIRCVNSFDCPSGKVCDREENECVECNADGDCEEDRVCIHKECTPSCTSDKDCVSLNKLCHPVAGACVQCVEDVDCPDVYHCRAGICVHDVCPQGGAICGTDRRSLAICHADGGGFDVRACDFDRSCVEPQEEMAECREHVCSPGAHGCSSDGAAVHRCRDDGQGVERVETCDDGTLCVGGECIDTSCSPGETFCDGDAVVRCNANGTDIASRTPCGPWQYCNPETQRCEEGSCARDDTACDGTVITECTDPRSGYVRTDTDCADRDEVCEDGMCVPRVCPPGERFCHTSGDIRECNEAGTDSSIHRYCQATTQGDRVCDASGGSPECVLEVCSPEQPACVGNTAGVCNDLGTGLGEVTGDCDESGKRCFEGECKEQVCEGARVCRDGNVHACADNGTSTWRYQTCGRSQFCRETESSAECSDPICAPGASGCDGDVIATCNEEGSGWVDHSTDCAQSGEVCVSGACLPVICDAGERYCDGQSLMQCGTKGATSSQITTCSSSQFCDDSGDGALCRSDTCLAGTDVCRGNVVTTCKADGSGPEDTGGTECAEGRACYQGLCQDVICEADTYICGSNENVRLCNSAGTDSSSYKTCYAPQHCRPDAGEDGGADCVADVCAQSQASCDGEVATTCNADGSGWEPGGVDCATSDQVCDGTDCVASAVDTVGLESSTTASESRLLGNYYQVRTARSLTEIEQYASVSGTFVFTWLVYEADAPDGSYTEIFRETKTSSGSEQFHSSGAIDVPLEAGKFYLIGVFIDGPHSYYSSNPSNVDEFVSFGQAIYGESDPYGAAPPSPTPDDTDYPYGDDERAYYQRLTTELP